MRRHKDSWPTGWAFLLAADHFLPFHLNLPTQSCCSFSHITISPYTSSELSASRAVSCVSASSVWCRSSFCVSYRHLATARVPLRCSLLLRPVLSEKLFLLRHGNPKRSNDPTNSRLKHCPSQRTLQMPYHRLRGLRFGTECRVSPVWAVER